MKTLIFILFWGLLSVSTATFGTEQRTGHPREAWLTVEQVISDIELAELAYQRIHPGYTRYAKAETLDAAWQQVIDQAKSNDGMAVGDFYLALSRILAMIRCDHTKAEVPKALKQERNRTPVYLPFHWTTVEDRAWIIAADKDSGLTYADELLKVDGKPIATMIKTLEPYIGVDGYTDHVKEIYMAASAEHMGGAVDHFGAFLWQPKPTVEIQVRTQANEVKTFNLPRVTHAEWLALDPADTSARDFSAAVQFKLLNDNGAYLRIDSFVNYRNPVDPISIYQPIFQVLQQRSHLILDLRNNGGGSSEPALELLRHLMTEAFSPVKDLRVKTLNFDGLRENLSTWDSSALYPDPKDFVKNKDGSYSIRSFMQEKMRPVEPADYHFKGKLIVLTSKSNSSGSTNLLSQLRQRPEVTFIGQRTGGNVEGPTAGVIFFLTLPASKIIARIPAIRTYNNVAGMITDKGIQPDILVQPSITGLVNRQDDIYQAAINHIRQGKLPAED